jgi:hypothetical protein
MNNNFFTIVIALFGGLFFCEGTIAREKIVNQKTELLSSIEQAGLERTEALVVPQQVINSKNDQAVDYTLPPPAVASFEIPQAGIPVVETNQKKGVEELLEQATSSYGNKRGENIDSRVVVDDKLETDKSGVAKNRPATGIRYH